MPDPTERLTTTESQFEIELPSVGSLMRCATCLLTLWVLPAGSTLTGQASVAGTYHLWLCERECTVADSLGSIGEAMFVLSDEPMDAAPEPLRWLRIEPEQANACFVITRSIRSVRGEELFFGIVRRASTVWRGREGGTFSVQVYQSPDAFYQLQWEGEGAMVRGEGWSSFVPGTPWHRNAFFVATRVGPPDVGACGG